jgi:hypothetical protein
VSSDETIHTIKPLINPIITINSTGNRALLIIHPDGTVTGEIEDASEAAKVFFESLRGYLPQPQTDALKIAREAAIEECALLVEGMGTSHDSHAGERFAKAIRALKEAT